MNSSHSMSSKPLDGIVFATGEVPYFEEGERVKVMTRAPLGHYRVPTYVRGKIGTIERVMEPPGIDNEEEGYGRNAGSKRHYYRIAIPMAEIWSDNVSSPLDSLRIEVFESWLERI